MRHLLDKMADSCLSRGNVKAGDPNRLAETTAIHRVFGGSLRSQVDGYLYRTVRVWPPFCCITVYVLPSEEYMYLARAQGAAL